MDPDVALAEILEQCADILADDHHSATTMRLAEQVDALNEWLTVRGGFLPKAWERE